MVALFFIYFGVYLIIIIIIIIARFYSLTNVAMLLLRSDSNSYSLLVGSVCLRKQTDKGTLQHGNDWIWTRVRRIQSSRSTICAISPLCKCSNFPQFPPPPLNTGSVLHPYHGVFLQCTTYSLWLMSQWCCLPRFQDYENP